MTVEYNFFFLKLINTSIPGITEVALKTLQMVHANENAWTVSESLVSALALSSEQLSTVETQPLSAPSVLNKEAGNLFFRFHTQNKIKN